jgi:signal transduction histidine kinase/CheY-like chemotaxis protein
MGKPAPRTVPRPGTAFGQWPRLGGLGAKLVLAQLLVAGLLLITGWVLRSSAQTAQNRILFTYDHRIFPLHRLSQLADSFAIDFVDTVHKVSDGSLSPEQGASRLERVRREADRGWREAEALMTAPAERRVASEIAPIFAEAMGSLTRAQAMMNAGDVPRLASWRKSELYVRIDPLTERLQRQIQSALDVAHTELFALRGDLSQAAGASALVLGVAGLVAVAAGIFVAARFVASLRHVERVVNGAAAGDLGLRIDLPGHDELSAMASSIDAMIDAIQKSQSELSQQARALARSEAEARAASTAKSAFLGNVSHELRTPLNVILGYAQALDRDPALGVDVRRGISRIEEAGQHLLQLIDDVIGVARLDQTALAIRRSPFAPTALLASVETMLSDRARSKGLRFEVSAVGRVPLGLVSDRRRLLQVLLNLTGNAIKFTSKGSVTLHMSWQDERLRFEVCDTGPGIPAAEQQLLFQSFSQGSLGRSSGEGTGLGLHISREIARVLGGDITLISAPGRGSTFICEIDAPEGTEEAEPELAARTRSAPPGHALPPMLVVDDRQTNREVLCALLRSSGFDTLEADSGEAALAILATTPVSLVWLDMKMPGMDGSEVLRRQRAREAERALPRTMVVLITASVVDLDRAQALAMGFDDWVPKPFPAVAVLDAVQRLTGLKLVSAAPPKPIASEAPQRSFDVSSLAAEQRRELRDLLTLGDIAGAAAWAQKLGPSAEPLLAQINAFRTDALLDSLRASENRKDQGRVGT